MCKLVFIVILFTGTSSWAKFKNNPEMIKFHAINSKVADLLNPKNASQIKKISKSIKSPKDRMHFEKLYVQKKASSVSMMPFMDKLVIKEGQKTSIIQLVSVKPLTIKLNHHYPIKIDGNNILKSISFDKKKGRNALLELLLPSANAWGSSDGSEWAFMYSAVADSVASETGFGGKIAIDQASFGQEVAQFIQKFDIKNFNCNHGVQGYMHAGATLFYGISYTNTKGQRFIGSCGEGVSSCIAAPTSNTGSVDSVLIDYEKSEKAVRSAVARQAQITADAPNFSINDFETNCRMENGWTGEYPACSLEPLRPDKYSAEVLERLKTTNLLADDQYNNTELSQHIETTMNFGQGLAQMEMSQNEGFVLSALSACCKSTECSEQAKDKLPMSSDIPQGISQ